MRSLANSRISSRASGWNCCWSSPRSCHRCQLSTRVERAAGAGRVHECQTPVFLWADVDAGRVRVFADVAPEAPTVKGFVSLLTDIFSGSTPDEVLTFEPNLVSRFGLADALGMVRMRGLSAIAQRIRQKVAQAVAN